MVAKDLVWDMVVLIRETKRTCQMMIMMMTMITTTTTLVMCGWMDSWVKLHNTHVVVYCFQRLLQIVTWMSHKS